LNFEEHFNSLELSALWQAMPPGAILHYSYSDRAYEIRVTTEGMRSIKLLRSIPRGTVMSWRDPRLTLNYAARHALKQAGLPVEVRVK
jgi:hypothetical protein